MHVLAIGIVERAYQRVDGNGVALIWPDDRRTDGNRGVLVNLSECRHNIAY